MYSVCITDDEEYIRESIYRRIENSGIPVIVAGMAENGKEAIALYQETKPDLFFIDIRMPGMSGLDVIEEIRKSDPETSTRFVVISGYDDFAYMQRAIKMGCTDYIKKPIRQDEFEEMLQAACQFIDVERAKKRAERETKRFYWENFTEDGQRKDVSGSFLLVYRSEIRKFELLKKLEELCPSQDWEFLFFHNVSDCVMLYSRTKGTEIAKEIVEKLHAHVVRREGKHMETRDLLHFMDMALAERFIRKSPFLKDCPDTMGNFDKITTQELAAALDNKKENRIREVITAMVDQTMSDRKRVEQIVQLFQFIVTEIANGYIRHGKPIPPAIRQEFLPMSLARYPDIRSVSDTLAEYGLELHDELIFLERKRDVVWKVVEYMEQHYSEDLSLTSLAEEFFLAPTYLAKCFKDKTGSSVMQYLEGYRMQRAQELLRSSSLSISEIALKSGYNDSNYFTRSFRKYSGVTPREYRNSRK